MIHFRYLILGCGLISLSLFSCQSISTQLTYKGPSLELTETYAQDSLRTINLQNIKDRKVENTARLKKTTPIVEKLWTNALADIESNIVETKDGKYFGAGKSFGLIIYTRDISYAGIFGLNVLYPQIMLNSLKTTRDVRLRLGFHVSKGHFSKDINAPWIEEPISEPAFLNKHHTNSYSRRTDDVVWLWSICDLFEKNKELADWQWLYQTANKCFDILYKPFYDSEDGLYRGQASFVDVHFTDFKTTGYPQEYTINECLTLKALSTNCLYYQGLKSMITICKKANKPAEAKEWKKRAENLKKAIRQNLRRKDGTMAYFKAADGHLENRRDALGSALAVITGVLEGKDAQKALDGYPMTWAGMPILYPFYPWKATYHNNTSWSFVDTFFLWARSIAYKEDNIGYNLALLTRTCVNDGSFHEFVNFKNKQPQGSGSQLWTAASFVNVCLRGKLLDKSTLNK